MNGKRVTVFLLTLLVLSLTLLSASAVMAQSTTRATLVATLSGDKEVPGPGDPDGAGSATIKVNVHKQTVCYELDVWDIEPAVAAHIHVGKSTVAGPVVVALDAPTDGSSDGCATGVDKALIRNIIRHPFQYYVNVHTADYPAGVVRGQLRVISD